MKLIISAISICIVLLLVVYFTNREGDNESAPLESSMLETKVDRPNRVAPDATPMDNQYIRENWPTATPASESAIAFEEAPTTEAKLAVLEELEATDPESLAKALRRAMLHPDDELRRQAVLMTQGLYPFPAEAIEILSAGGFDRSRAVRDHALEMIHEQQPEAKLEVLENTLDSPFEDVQETSLTELGRLSTKPALEIIFQGLDDEDPAYVKMVNDEIDNLIDKRFSSTQEATEWWERVSEKYDRRLFRFAD